MGLFSQTIIIIPVAIEIDLQFAPGIEHGAANSILEITLTGQL